MSLALILSLGPGPWFLERARCKIASKNKDTDFPEKGWPVSLFVVKLMCEKKPYHKRVYNS